MSSQAGIGVIGGSGFYEFVEPVGEVTVETPFGLPSDPIMLGDVAGQRVAFLPRHGRDHRFPPHRIPYRANLWALRSLGVRQILAPTAVGSLTPSYGPGTLVIPDQLVDRPGGRPHTVCDEAAASPGRSADPSRRVARPTPMAAGSAAGWDLADSGTLVV